MQQWQIMWNSLMVFAHWNPLFLRALHNWNFESIVQFLYDQYASRVYHEGGNKIGFFWQKWNKNESTSNKEIVSKFITC